MKLLKDQDYNSMKQKSGHWESLVSSLLEGTDMNREEQTPDTIISLIENSRINAGDDDRVKTMQSTMDAKDREIRKLKSEIEELRKTPAAPASDPAVTHEAAAAVEDINEFAKVHADDTAAIMAKAKEVGFF